METKFPVESDFGKYFNYVLYFNRHFDTLHHYQKDMPDSKKLDILIKYLIEEYNYFPINHDNYKDLYQRRQLLKNDLVDLI